MLIDITRWHAILVEMATRLKLDKLGRIVLPKAVRERLQVSAGDQFELESSDDRIMLKPVRENAQLRKKQGVWVYQSGELISEMTVQQTVEQIRRERDDQNRDGNP